ncbi:hypothetical protein OSB04_004100 [Centaurea solstitialis]|uniref:GDSL esterase/lipase n=1 Tax=Centaurea solstitialis TaxID=347529 RepID=A0AA38TXX4_9ASTR|nr:hypothetical protein OSB04_004100 [Centaurea solstitialis]
MATPLFSWLYLSCAFLLLGSSNLVLCQSSVPGLYIFGDSLIDPGNNNYLPQSGSRANFPYNGIDFPNKEPTGRFSNGKNAADFLAEKVGLPLAPPYLSLSKKTNATVVVTGVSFASGGSGIFNETGISLVNNGPTTEILNETDDENTVHNSFLHLIETINKSILATTSIKISYPKFTCLIHIQPLKVIPLTKQVEYYSLVHDQLVQQLGAAGAKTHLSKSLFVIIIGSNDMFRYFTNDSKVSKQYTPQQYVELMAFTLKPLIKKMHELGARKFVVSGVPVIGCSPLQRKLNNTECNAEPNYWSVKYNDALQSLLTKLKSKLSDINYSYFHLYDAMNHVIEHHQTYGFAEIKAACCGNGYLNADAPCYDKLNATYCSIRENHLFWDAVHPTETASGIFANILYSGSGQFTTPMNVEQLVKA